MRYSVRYIGLTKLPGETTDKTEARVNQMQTDNPIMRYFNVRRVPRIHPGLLTLAALVATVPIYPPNARLYAILLADPTRGRNFMLAAVATLAILGLACATKGSRCIDWNGPARWKCFCTAGVYLTGQAGFIACLLNTELPAGLAPVFGMLLGAALLPLTLSWIDRFSGDLRSIMVHGGLVCACSALLNWMLSMLDRTPLAAALICLGALGAIAPTFLPIRGPISQTEGGLESKPAQPGEAGDFTHTLANMLSIIWLPLLGFLLFLFMTNAYEFSRDFLPMSTETTGALIASAITLAVGLLHYSTPLVIAVDKLVIPVCAALCVILGSFPAGSPAFFIGAVSVYAPLIFMSIYAGASVVAVSKAGEFPMPFIAGVTVFCASLASILGGLLSGSFQDTVNFGQLTWIIIVLYVGVIIVNLGYTSWRKECSPAEESGVRLGPDSTPADQAILRDQLLAARVETLASEHGLTERETEILGYLARGFTSTYIASSLLISANTVRTHMYNMYRKLGVTSREELLALINQ